MHYPTLPESVRAQIYDGSMYDYYGKLGFAFEDSYIDGPTGKAKDDYEAWLVDNPQIALEIDTKIRVNMLKYGMITPSGNLVKASIPIEQIQQALRENMRPDRPILKSSSF